MMKEYENKCCVCCGKKFTDDDDIVVCPECGTPMHRSCWNGHCPNEDKHAQGFDWDKAQESAPQSANAAASPSDMALVRCDICGMAIEPDEEKVYCPECGTPMHRNCYESFGHCPHESEHALGYSWKAAHERSSEELLPPMTSIDGFDEFMERMQENPMKNESSGEEITCCGVKQTELLHFLGMRSLSTPRFFALFMNMAITGKKVSFNFFAGLFMPFYQFYRKMTGPAILMTAAYFIMNIPQFVVQYNFVRGGTEMHISPELLSIYNIMTYVGLIVEILVILFNDYIYMKWSVGKILSLRERYRNAPESEYMEALERAGRPRMAFAFAALGAFAIIFCLIFVFLSGSSLRMC